MSIHLKIQYYIRVFVAPAILVAVAFLQVYRVHAYGQTPWKGGGFGMFSSTDRPSRRFLRCYLITRAGEIPVKVPSHLSPLAAVTRSVPTSHNLRRVAEALGSASWVCQRPFPKAAARLRVSSQPPLAKATSPESEVTDPRSRVQGASTPGMAPGDVIDVVAVRVELWHYQLVSRTHQLQARKWVEATAERQS